MNVFKLTFLVLSFCTLYLSHTVIQGVLSEALAFEEYEPRSIELEGWFSDQELKSDFISLSELARKHEDFEVRWRATELLELNHGEKALEVFQDIAKTESHLLVKRKAAGALARLGDKPGISLLRGVMEAEKSMVFKLQIAGELVDLGELSGYQYILEASKSNSTIERSYSLLYYTKFFQHGKRIAQLYKVDPFEAFLEYSQDPDPYIRIRFVLLTPKNGLSEDMVEKYFDTINKLSKNDSDANVKRSASRWIRIFEFKRKQKEMFQDNKPEVIK